MSTATPNCLLRLGEQLLQRGVVGRIEPVDALQRGADRERLAIDLVGLRDDARDGAKAADHPHRLGIGIMRQPLAEQDRIELVGLAIDVEIGPREMGIEQGRAQIGHEAEKLLDIGILRAPEASANRAWRRPERPADRPGRYGAN